MRRFSRSARQASYAAQICRPRRWRDGRRYACAELTIATLYFAISLRHDYAVFYYRATTQCLFSRCHAYAGNMTSRHCALCFHRRLLITPRYSSFRRRRVYIAARCTPASMNAEGEFDDAELALMSISLLMAQRRMITPFGRRFRALICSPEASRFIVVLGVIRR